MRRGSWLAALFALGVLVVVSAPACENEASLRAQPLPAKACNTNNDCPGTTCNLIRHLCVGCNVDPDCTGGDVCRQHECVQGCSAGKGCGGGKVCDVAQGACVECTSDRDCKKPEASRCDLKTNACVQCLPTKDNCPAGQYCNATACVAGCRSDSDCAAGNPSPASQGKSHCTLSTHSCVACTSECGAGQTCCDTSCVNTLEDAKNCGTCGNACATDQVCCAGYCRKPDETGLCPDCKRKCDQREVTGEGFARSTTVSDLIADPAGVHTATFPPRTPVVWVAMHDSNSVNMFDANTGALLNTVSSRGQKPSRGSVALDYSYWLGNRCDNDPNNPSCSNVAQILPDGTPGCTVGKAADGAPMPFVRALAIDAKQFVWAGTWNDARIHKIDPTTCKTVLDVPLTKNGMTSRPYGMAIDANGLMWISVLDSGRVVAFDTKTNEIVDQVAMPGNTYGVVVDRNNNAFFAQWTACNGGVFRVDAATHAVTSIGSPSGGCTRGMTIDSNGDIWAANWTATTPSRASKFAGGTGTFISSYTFADINGGVGISGDANGKVWLTSTQPISGTYNMVRFDKDTGVVDLTKALPGVNAYNYSDWLGYQARTVVTKNPQSGTVTAYFDGYQANTLWTTATWTSSIPAGAQVKVRFRAESTKGGLANATWCGPTGPSSYFLTSPVDLSVCGFGQKQWLEVDMILLTNDSAQPASVSDLKVYFQNPN